MKRRGSSWTEGQIRHAAPGCLPTAPGNRILRRVFKGRNKEIRHRDDVLQSVQTPVFDGARSAGVNRPRHPDCAPNAGGFRPGPPHAHEFPV